MNKELFFKRVYTVAFRLTGEKSIAGEISARAIINTMEEYKGYNQITANMFRLTILELVKIFLTRPVRDCGEDLKDIQGALLKLKPINRAVIVWKDVLGYKLLDNVPIMDYPYEELLKELISGRKELKYYISLEENREDFEIRKYAQ